MSTGVGPLFSLSERRALVTGASRGPGRAMAEAQHRVAAIVQWRHHCAGVHSEQACGGGCHQGTRERVGKSGVQVNAIAPGYFRTDNTQALQDEVRAEVSVRHDHATTWRGRANAWPFASTAQA